MSKVFLFLVSAVVAVFAANGTEPNARCTSPGLMCKNCNQVAICVLNPGHILTQMDVITCAGSCRNGTCVEGAVCNYRPFTCSLGETGGFPDPYDCTKFHICDGTTTTPITRTCPVDKITGEQTAYGSETNSCLYPVAGNPNCINAPVPRCTQNLEVDVLASDPNIYYICTQSGNPPTLGPNLFRCPPQTSFNKATFVCS